MNPQYIFVSGATFYFIRAEDVIRQVDEVPDLVRDSYEACHMDAFGHVGGQPCRAGASYGRHFAVNGLYQLAGV